MYFSEHFGIYFIDTSNLFKCVIIYDKLRTNNRFASDDVKDIYVTKDIPFNDRLSISFIARGSNDCNYWLTNDERRSLMKKLKERIEEKIKDFSLNDATINIGEFKDEI